VDSELSRRTLSFSVSEEEEEEEELAFLSSSSRPTLACAGPSEEAPTVIPMGPSSMGPEPVLGCCFFCFEGWWSKEKEGRTR
jgi:hypothetical protein